MRILLAVDGSEYTVKSVRYLATHLQWFREPPELHLLHVRMPIPSGMARAAAGADAVERYYREEADAALEPAETVLRELGIPYLRNYRVGEVAAEIQAYVADAGIDLIVMGSHGHGALKNLVMGSVATKVLAATATAVLIVR